MCFSLLFSSAFLSAFNLNFWLYEDRIYTQTIADRIYDNNFVGGLLWAADFCCCSFEQYQKSERENERTKKMLYGHDNSEYVYCSIRMINDKTDIYDIHMWFLFPLTSHTFFYFSSSFLFVYFLYAKLSCHQHLKLYFFFCMSGEIQ